jgi:hypothetical protein
MPMVKEEEEVEEAPLKNSSGQVVDVVATLVNAAVADSPLPCLLFTRTIISIIITLIMLHQQHHQPPPPEYNPIQKEIRLAFTNAIIILRHDNTRCKEDLSVVVTMVILEEEADVAMLFLQFSFMLTLVH